MPAKLVSSASVRPQVHCRYPTVPQASWLLHGNIFCHRWLFCFIPANKKWDGGTPVSRELRTWCIVFENTYVPVWELYMSFYCHIILRKHVLPSYPSITCRKFLNAHQRPTYVPTYLPEIEHFLKTCKVNTINIQQDKDPGYCLIVYLNWGLKNLEPEWCEHCLEQAWIQQHRGIIIWTTNVQEHTSFLVICSHFATWHLKNTTAPTAPQWCTLTGLVLAMHKKSSATSAARAHMWSPAVLWCRRRTAWLKTTQMYKNKLTIRKGIMRPTSLDFKLHTWTFDAVHTCKGISCRVVESICWLY